MDEHYTSIGVLTGLVSTAARQSFGRFGGTRRPRRHLENLPPLIALRGIFIVVSALPYVIDPLDPRAPSQEVWATLTDEQRRQVVNSLPSEFVDVLPPEGDAHRHPKTRAIEALSEFFRTSRRGVYVSTELPVYYPGEHMFAPDLIAVVDTSDHERNSWVTSHEGKGLDFALEFNVSGSKKKDFEDNVVRFARLGIPEYFAFDVVRSRLLGWRLPDVTSRAYVPVMPQGGRWRSEVLGLELAVEGRRLRFYNGNAPLLDGQEWIARLGAMVDEAARRAEDEARRVERLAARLRELGVDPDEIE